MQTHYANKFRAALADRPINPDDKLYILKRIYEECIVRGVDKYIVFGQNKAYF